MNCSEQLPSPSPQAPVLAGAAGTAAGPREERSR